MDAITTTGDGPLVAIVGETASGKSALAMELALLYDGEIICADSRTVYKGMDIGTDKPTKRDQTRVPHHLLDMVNPDESFTAADFKRCATLAVKDIHRRGKLPILVGGSGLYVDSVLFDYAFAAPADSSFRAELEAMTVPLLLEYAAEHEVALGNIERANKRHIVRAIERGGMVKQQLALRPHTIVVGMKLPRDILRSRIVKRIDAMFDNGFIDETKRLADLYGWGHQGGSIYNFVESYLADNISLQEVKDQLVRKHLDLAKRQRTWFKRNKSIHWAAEPREAVDFVTTFLNKIQ